MRACWLKWVGRDWSISADYIWLNYSGANTETLLRCYEAYIEGRLTSDAFKGTLRQSSGLISPDAFGLHG